VNTAAPGCSWIGPDQRSLRARWVGWVRAAIGPNTGASTSMTLPLGWPYLNNRLYLLRKGRLK